jgi:CubicO group peptidase (beta-lactamase class C family)
LAKTTYSDLGFIALGALLEERLEMPLEDAFNGVARSYYGTTSMQYVPLWRDGFHSNYCDCAPTEACPWRKRVVQGQVHDDNAFVMGGVAGHAGLFGTLDDVSQASYQMLRRVMRPTTDLDRVLSSFVQAEGIRGMGFDRPTPGGTTGNALSSSAFGHLGFTGTSVWMDPQAPSSGGAVFILLTNRVHPSREREGIRALRIGFHEKARRWLEAFTRNNE